MANKIRTEQHLQNELDKEFAWRVREITALKAAVRSASGTNKNAVLRAAVAILYSHWEGFIKNSSWQYAEYLSNTGLKFSDVKLCFLGIAAKESINLINQSNKLGIFSSAIESIFNKKNERLSLNLKKYTDRVGNMNFEMFSAIAIGLGIDFSPYVTKKTLIDEKLLKKRNAIAHGVYLEVDENDLEKYTNDVIELIRNYKTDIENSVSLQSYKV